MATDQLSEACWQEEGELDSDDASLCTQESSDVDECGEEDADRVSEETLKKLGTVFVNVVTSY